MREGHPFTGEAVYNAIHCSFPSIIFIIDQPSFDDHLSGFFASTSDAKIICHNYTLILSWKWKKPRIRSEQYRVQCRGSLPSQDHWHRFPKRDINKAMTVESVLMHVDSHATVRSGSKTWKTLTCICLGRPDAQARRTTELSPSRERWVTAEIWECESSGSLTGSRLKVWRIWRDRRFGQSLFLVPVLNHVYFNDSEPRDFKLKH